MAKPFIPLRVVDPLLNRIQDGITSAFRKENTNPITQGRLVSNVNLPGGPTTFNHDLGRACQGVILVSISPPTITLGATAGGDTTVAVDSTGAGIASFWVF